MLMGCLITLLFLSFFSVSLRVVGGLIMLEVLSFFLILVGMILSVFSLRGSFSVLIYFVVFVLEGVLGIVCLINYVGLVGSDSMSVVGSLLWC